METIVQPSFFNFKITKNSSGFGYELAVKGATSEVQADQLANQAISSITSAIRNAAELIPNPGK